jgi:serine/threonine-protein kinase RsbW
MHTERSFQLSEKLLTDLKAVNPFIERVCLKIFALTGSEDEVFKVKLVLEEALTNAMRHGNALDPAREVTVRIEADQQKVVLDVHDEGKGFDFKKLPDPTERGYSDRVSGRGVFLMHKFMDEVEFYDGGSGVKMTKKFRV